MLSYEDSVAEKACNLECIQDLPPIHEFVGPVKIVLMDVPKEVYTRKACLAAFIGLASILMGTTTMIVLFYTLGFKTNLMMNLHILLCTIGYQLFIPSAILMVNPLHGPSSPLRVRDRKFQHLFLQIFGLGCVTAGSVVVMLFGGGSFKSRLTLHSMAGLVAGGLSAIAALMGPGAYFSKDTGTLGKVGKRTHTMFGMPAFLASSVCFIIGIMNSKTFKAWVVFLPDIKYIVIAFCVVYTLIILATPAMKFFGKTP
ncbi:uncharacterized protein LOC135078274 [Ostrinia nubilalis]|uniref:uncharacterized protein LOC135078274 n=1 Tax=Ostrinia nubilalis TaxID=29057 RepID=UPI0030825488